METNGDTTEEEKGAVAPLYHFVESNAEELSSIVSSLPHVCGELRPSEKATEKFTGICACVPCTHQIVYVVVT